MEQDESNQENGCVPFDTIKVLNFQIWKNKKITFLINENTEIINIFL